MSRLPRIYLAGKIKAGDWRHDLIGGQRLRNAALRYDDTSRAVQPEAAPIFGGFEYAGPYFLGDDHSCFHGPHSHGFGALLWPGCEPSNIHHDDLGRALTDGNHAATYGRTRDIVQRSCLAWIRSADVVFAWVEQWDAYATLLEIGYAHARGIPVFLGLNLMYQPKEVPDAPSSVWNDWWFAEQTATKCEYEVNARAAWATFSDWWSTSMQGYWAMRRAHLEEGGAWCPTHRLSSSRSR